MPIGKINTLIMLALVTVGMIPTPSRALTIVPHHVKQVVDGVIHPLMEKDRIPGMAVGVIVDGRAYILNYGVSSLATRHPVTDSTLFELGSISKTFTATLAAWAQAQHALSLSKRVDTYLPGMRGHAFGCITLLELGTHTAGGFPLQVPTPITNVHQLTMYLQAWRPTHKPGTSRRYSNISIGMLGRITSRALGRPFGKLMQSELLPALGLHDSFLRVPTRLMGEYAQGYTSDGKPIRVAPGVLEEPAYGMHATATDMLIFLQDDMGLRPLPSTLRKAIATTQTAYFRAGPLQQDLIWEQYPYPVTLRTLLAGNSGKMLFRPTPAVRFMPPHSPRGLMWINKTGSTNGFGAYVAFVPSKRLGIVLLANRSLSLHDRVVPAYRILRALNGIRISAGTTSVNRVP